MSTTQSPPIDLDMVGSVFQARATAAEQLCLQVADRCRQLQGELNEARAELAALKAGKTTEGQDNGNR